MKLDLQSGRRDRNEPQKVDQKKKDLEILNIKKEEQKYTPTPGWFKKVGNWLTSKL